MRKFVVMLLVSVIVGMFAVSCDEDCPTCPPPPQEIVSDYDVYFMGLNSQPIYVYNTKARKLVDSIDLLETLRINSLAVSGDGRDLLFTITYPVYAGFRALNLETRDTVGSFFGGAKIEVSNTGKYIALIDPTKVYILDGKTYALLFDVDVLTEDVRFLSDDSKFFCIHDQYYIRIYDMHTQAMDTVFRYYDESGLSPVLYTLHPNADGSKLYMTCWYPPDLNFLIAYSLTFDSTTFQYPIAPVYDSDLHLTPDGKQIIFDDAGFVNMDYLGTMYIFYIDPETDAIISIIDAKRIGPGIGMAPGKFVITPDGKYSIFASAGGGWSFGMADNVEHRFVDLHVFEPQTVSFSLPVCQKLAK